MSRTWRPRLLVAALAWLALAGTPSQAAPTDTPPSQAELRESAWEAAQWSFRSGAGAALVQMSARFARKDDALGRLERQRATLSGRLGALDRSILQTVTRTDEQSAAELDRLRQERARVAEALRAISAIIERDFPAYAELARPRVVPSRQLQALLSEDEGLLLIVSDETSSYLFAVTHDRFEWRRSPRTGLARIDAAVARLRAGLQPPRATGVQVPFDTGLANELFRELVQPADALLASKSTLIVVTSGSLASLPFGVLVTDPDAARSGSATAGWLIDRQALAALPSVSSLFALRCLRRDGGKPAPGCPDLGRDEPVAARSSSGLLAIGAPELGPPRDASRGAGPSAVFAGSALADGALLRQFGSLPGAERELLDLKTHFPGARIVERGAATETYVRRSGDVRNARYLVLATHGLLAGQAGPLSEPGLVFTPPPQERRSAEDDGYLSASEAAGLTLSADVVALSACNTAAADGFSSGDEWLSGLARGFFYAGARSLLVSHWEVNDAATASIMLGTFRRLEASGGAGRAAALRDAIRSLRADTANPYWTRPYYWAAFSLVGDPA